jgi:hypothetical protein
LTGIDRDKRTLLSSSTVAGRFRFRVQQFHDADIVGIVSAVQEISTFLHLEWRTGVVEIIDPGAKFNIWIKLLFHIILHQP